MSSQLCREALEQTLLFGALAAAELDELAQACTVRRYRRGEQVVREGDPGGDLLVVSAGRVKVLSRSADGRQFVLSVAVPGDTLGELSLFDALPRSASLEAIEACVVVVVPGVVVRRTVLSHADLAVELLRQQADLIRRVSGLAADLVFLDLPRRVARYVVEHSDHRGRVDLGMSQTDLAEAVGGVRQSVNGALRTFERRGWINVVGRCIEVSDRAALRAFAEAAR